MTILAKTDLETLKDYLKLQILLSTASALSEEMGQTPSSISTGRR